MCSRTWGLLATLFLCASAAARAPGADTAPLLGAPDFLPTPAHPIGFRGDWTGKYPGATPPAKLSLTEGVVWKTEVGVGESPPVIVGSKAFILTNGICLTCLDSDSGKVLWRRDHHLEKASADELGYADLEEWVRSVHRLRPVRERIAEVEREAAALRRDAAKLKKPDEAERLAGLEKTLIELKAQPEPLEQSTRAAAAKITVENISGQLSRGKTDSTQGNAMTWAIATPCSDGERLYAWLPTGVIACYDLEGGQLWARVLGKRRACGGWYGGQVAPSPLLADGKLVIHYDALHCLDAKTGRTLWQAPEPTLCIPSPVAGCKNGAWYVATGPIKIYRLADGKCLYAEKGIWHDNFGVGSPIAFDGIFCWTSHALELPDTPDGEPRLLWQLDGDTAGRLTSYNHVHKPDGDKPYRLRGMGWHGYASPVMHDGLIYYHHEGGMYSAIEARTGKWVFTRNLVMQDPKSRNYRCGGEVYPSLVMAGECCFAVGGQGVIMALKAGREADPHVAGESRLADMGGNAPVFQGQRVFVHTGRMLYCLGPSAP